MTMPLRGIADAHPPGHGRYGQLVASAPPLSWNCRHPEGTWANDTAICGTGGWVGGSESTSSLYAVSGVEVLA
jgi:hypothetical protein